MTNFNICERLLQPAEGGNVIEALVGELARAAATVAEERTVYELGACLTAAAYAEVA